MIRWRIAALLLLLPTLSTGCGDSCGEIACLPAPPPLEVLVVDTISVDTTIRRMEMNDSIDVDTTVVRKAPTSAARVLMVLQSDSVLTSVGELQRIDTLYQELDISRIPTGEFRLQALRDGRSVLSNRLLIQRVEGCCPYSMVGRFTFTLPTAIDTL